VTRGGLAEVEQSNDSVCPAHRKRGHWRRDMANQPSSPTSTPGQAAPELLQDDDPARHDHYALVSRLDEAIDAAVAKTYLVNA
jgi:hypothetical protein